MMIVTTATIWKAARAPRRNACLRTPRQQLAERQAGASADDEVVDDTYIGYRRRRLGGTDRIVCVFDSSGELLDANISRSVVTSGSRVVLDAIGSYYGQYVVVVVGGKLVRLM